MGGSGIRAARYLLQAGADYGALCLAQGREGQRQPCSPLRGRCLGGRVTRHEAAVAPRAGMLCPTAGVPACLGAAHLTVHPPQAALPLHGAVLCNEGDASNSACLEANLAAAAEAAAAAAAGGSSQASGLVVDAATPGGGRAWHLEAQQQQQLGDEHELGSPLCELAHEEAVR